MKKVIISVIAILILVGCSADSKSPELNLSFQRNAIITLGDFSYNALVKYDENTLYITATSTNANGMTISCNSKSVVYSYNSFIKSFEKSDISPYNPTVLLYDALNCLFSCEIEKEDDGYTYLGKNELGPFYLKFDNSGNICSFLVDNAQIFINFL